MSKKTAQQLKEKLGTPGKDLVATDGIAVTIEKRKGDILKALPKGMDVDRFMRIALTSVRTSPDLTRIAAQNPMSIIGAVMLSAQLGLEPMPRRLS